MMHQTTAILAILGSVLVSGCTTTIIHEYHGEVRNIKRDEQIATIRDQIPGYCSGPSRDGGRFVGFFLPMRGFSLFVFHPALARGQTLVTNTGSQQVSAWLLRGHEFTGSDVVRSGDPEELRQHGGERLEGRVAVRWRSNADFYIGVDLAAGDVGSTSLRGEFVGYTETKADPNVLWLGPAMLLFGAGGWSNPTPVANPADTTKNR